MAILISKKALAHAILGGPKCIVTTSCMKMVKERLTHLQMTILEGHLSEEGLTIYSEPRDANLTKLPLSSPIHGLVLVVGEGKVESEALARIITDHQIEHGISFRPVASGFDDLALAIDVALEAYAAQLQAEVAELRHQVTVLRDENADTRLVLSNLQDLLANLGQCLPIVTLDDKVGDKLWGPPPDHAKGAHFEVVELPLGSLGLSRVDLFVKHSADKDAQGSVLANLVDVDSGELIGSWLMDFADLLPGWIALEFDETKWGPNNPLELELTWNTIKGSAPRFAADSDGKRAALRLWGSVPGVVARQPRFWVGRDSGGMVKYSKHIERVFDIPFITERLRPTVTGELPPFEYCTPHQGSILLHPIPNRISSAVVKGLDGTNLEMFSSTVYIAHDKSPPVEFCLIATIADQEIVLGSSVWARIERSGEKVEVQALLSTPHEGEIDLHLLTRAVPMGNVDFAHAHWETFKARYRLMVFSNKSVYQNPVLMR